MNPRPIFNDLRPSAAMIERYREAFHEYGRNEKALLWSKQKQDLRFGALCRMIPDAPASLLDFGCGLGDLALWLKRHRPSIEYLGVDVVGDFIDSNRAALPQFAFQAIETPGDIPSAFDHIVCSGVFNIDVEDNAPRHWQYIYSTVKSLFAKSRRALHIDFLVSDVDFQKSGAYHQDPSVLAAFVGQELSRRYVLDRSYMPYEFCISIFADTTIERTRNIYSLGVWR